MDAPVCSYLGALDPHGRREPHVEFPSFENYCFAGGSSETIMLGDQSTYCLSGGCSACPRFRAVRRSEATAGGFVPLYHSAEDAWQEPAPLPSVLDDADSLADTGNRRRWAWLSAAMLFLMVFVCGATVAAYAGWQYVGRSLPAAVTGRINTLSAAQSAPPPAVYLVLTATPANRSSPPPTVPVVALAPTQAAAAPASATVVYPAAVTPTPITLMLGPTAASPGEAGAVAGIAAGATGSAAEPAVNVDLPIPTRRPTPVFDLPTSTPLPAVAAATPSATPVPLGTPIVIFTADKLALTKGECTTVRWNVQNVREVYFETQPVNGQGQQEECIGKGSATFSLMVVLGTGQAQVYTTTLTYLAPTATPTVTPSFTPEPVYTPTWTPPPPPTATPKPEVTYGATLSLDGNDTLTCAAGQTCEAGLLAGNSGSAIDSLSVTIVGAGPYPIQICRGDGVCAGSSLLISSVAPGNTAYLKVRVSVPADAGGKNTAYSFQAFSEGSGRSTASNPVTLNVTVP